MFDMLSCAGGLVGQLRRAKSLMFAEHGGWGEGRSWGEATAGPKSGGPWGGGSGQQWGGWWGWPGFPGATGHARSTRSTKAGRGDVRAAILALLREGPTSGNAAAAPGGPAPARSTRRWRSSPTRA
jgi:hypothetical protein